MRRGGEKRNVARGTNDGARGCQDLVECPITQAHSRGRSHDCYYNGRDWASARFAVGDQPFEELLHGWGPRLAVKRKCLAERGILSARQHFKRGRLSTGLASRWRGEHAERTPATQHLVDYAGERIDVVTWIRVPTLHHLAARIGRRERQRPRPLVEQRAARDPGNAEVQQLR